jgi:hypothetical protein
LPTRNEFSLQAAQWLVDEADETYSHRAAEGEEEVGEKRWDNNEGNIQLVVERKVWPRNELVVNESVRMGDHEKVGTGGCWT